MKDAYGRAWLGGLVIAVAIGAAGAVGDVAEQRWGVSGRAQQWLQAVVCSGIAVPLIVWLRRRRDRLPLAGLGLPGLARSLRTCGLGVLVTSAAAAVTFGAGAAAGWVEFGTLTWPTLLRFAALNTAIAFLLEALPEELALRGYAYRGLNAALRRWTAAFWTTAIFLIAPGAASVIQAAIAAALGGPVHAPALAPGGQEPVAYLILLIVFGAALIVARITTGSLWAATGLHLTFLTVNRVVLLRNPERIGWSAAFTTPDAILLVPAYLVLAAVSFVGIARWQRRRIGWRDRDPEHGALASRVADT